jgi:hypothetical protein
MSVYDRGTQMYFYMAAESRSNPGIRLPPTNVRDRSTAKMSTSVPKELPEFGLPTRILRRNFYLRTELVAPQLRDVYSAQVLYNSMHRFHDFEYIPMRTKGR